MAKAELTVILPNMASLVQQEINKSIFPKTIQKVLDKATFSSDRQGFERRLFNHFSAQALPNNDLPIAKLRSQDDNVLCADPCYLHPDRDQLLLFSGSLDISSDEADELITAIQPLLDEFGATLTKLNNEQWNIKLETLPDLEFTALPEVTGKAVQQSLPKGDEQTRLQWLRLWNEIQMLLFDLPLNEKRQNQGKFPINSLWFWGGGIPELLQNGWQGVIGNDALLGMLAKQVNVECKPSLKAVEFDQIRGKQLVVFDALDLEELWPEQLENIELVFVKLWQSIQWNKLKKVNIEIPNFGNYELTPFDSWKPWL